MTNPYAERLLYSRNDLMANLPVSKRAAEAAEGGCGVLGFAANRPIAGRHVHTASAQMHNRGNGKGGGIAMVGLDPAQARVDHATLQTHTLLQVAMLDPEARGQVESGWIHPYFDIAQAYALDQVDDWREIPGLQVRPPEVWRYFVRVKPAVLEAFADEKNLNDLPLRALEDEFVYRNSFGLNREFYASLGEQRAFVLSHGRNLSVLKIVGYAEDVVAYYRLQDQTAHVWIAHQRYPTKGRVWHPGGAHPFIGLNEALVHNGDFANYHAVGEYLRQRNIGQLFLTDTEVSVQLFDLWDRVYGYPLEITLEAMAPTCDHDFAMLPQEKQAVYRAVQRTHIHGSPDGPWFFIVARAVEGDGADDEQFELLGITDTSMLRPQVFALYENPAQTVQIGLIASERQAINACLRSLSAEDPSFQPYADRYWVARGGSHTDGGAFRFRIHPERGSETPVLSCENKFGEAVTLAGHQGQVDLRKLPGSPPASFRRDWERNNLHAFDDGGPSTFWNWLQSRLAAMNWEELHEGLHQMANFAAQGEEEWRYAVKCLARLRDRWVPLGNKKRASLQGLVDNSLRIAFELAPLFRSGSTGSRFGGLRRLSWETRRDLNPPIEPGSVLVLDTRGFPPEGDEAAARYLVRAKQLGWKEIAAFGWQGGRFAGSGLGPDSAGLRLDLYGDVGDYAGSGLDGAEIHIHSDGQDQIGQILKSGRLVVHGDVGQTFLYGAKGGEAFVLGSAAGRPLINAVGRPRAVINGTCLDYLAESFMAGDPLQGGGFVILNGVAYDETGRLKDLESPYPGGNLFSLASGGAIYLRDPYQRVTANQLNGGKFAPLQDEDWELIQPYLIENERLFGIPMESLLTVDGDRRTPGEIYRKVHVGDGANVLRG